MSEHILRRHNKSLLLYHIVFPSKYRRKVITQAVEVTLKEACLGIGDRYEIGFIEIGVDEDHVHFLVQSVPTIPPGRIVQIIKSITAREIYRQNPEVKKVLWGGQIWTTGYYINTVGAYANEDVIRTYVEKQGKRYQKIYNAQLSFLDDMV
ncbi:IS200/IS605 family transposase [Candidatus Latescibacterota bacterium]